MCACTHAYVCKSANANLCAGMYTKACVHVRAYEGMYICIIKFMNMNASGCIVCVYLHMCVLGWANFL